MLEWSQMLDQKNPPQLLDMTSSKAFRCVQAWLLEKPAAWADDPCLAAALLEAERSHQRRRIELLEEQLLGEEAEVRRLEKCFAASTDLEEIMSKVSHVSAALQAPADAKKLVSEWRAELSRDVE